MFKPINSTRHFLITLLFSVFQCNSIITQEVTKEEKAESKVIL